MQSKYKVELVRGVRIITVQSGAGVPMSDYARLLKAAPSNAVMDLGLAQRIGAFAVFGKKADLAAYRGGNPPVCQKILALVAWASAKYQGEELAEIKAYLEGYERGESADALLHEATGIDCAGNPHAVPRDSDDTGRCWRLHQSCAVVRDGLKSSKLFASWPAERQLDWKSRVHATCAL